MHWTNKIDYYFISSEYNNINKIFISKTQLTRILCAKNETNEIVGVITLVFCLFEADMALCRSAEESNLVVSDGYFY